MIFKVDHIKKFDIIKKPEEVTQPPKLFQEQDPAIISAQTQEKKDQTVKEE